MSRLPITLCIGTRNAGSMLAACVDSCVEWVSEIVVVDMDSEDETLPIARRYGARIVPIDNAGIVEPGRQVAIDAASQPWVLLLDADERAQPGLEALLRDWVSERDLAGVFLPRKNYLFGRWLRHSGYWPDLQMRFFRPEAVTWPPTVHAVPHVDGRTIVAPLRPGNALVHLNYTTVSEWIDRNNHYTDYEVANAAGFKRRPGALHALANPVRMFLRRYIRERGFQDGIHGLAFALLMACYEVMRTLKVMEADGRLVTDDEEA